MGYVDLKEGLRNLRERNGVTQARDEAEAIWQNWERQGLLLEPGTVASIRRRGPGQKIGNRRRSGVHEADRAQHNSWAVPSLNPRSPLPGRCGFKRQVLWVHHTRSSDMSPTAIQVPAALTARSCAGRVDGRVPVSDLVIPRKFRYTTTGRGPAGLLGQHRSVIDSARHDIL